MSKKAIVAGATGLVGGFVVHHLTQSHIFDEVVVLVRPGSNLHLDGVTIQEVDYDRLEDFSDVLKADTVFCCLGTTMKKAGSKANFYKVDFTYPHQLARITYQHGATQFSLVSSSGASEKSLFYYSRVKGEIETAVCQIDFEKIDIFRPSLLLGKRPEKRPGENAGAVVAKLVNPFLVGSAKKYRAIQAETVAIAMVAVAEDQNRGVRILESDTIAQYGRR
ncbi:MAG: NAD-dependent epimerase/dehydratase family protein [Cyclobacteriaceae bacterium]|nr:NAD-dependent epimerase/dehydratase family protein [Cyclobacteriaceae bacterium]